MNQVKLEEEVHPCAPYGHTTVYQQTNQCYGVFPGGPFNFLPEGTQNLPPMGMTSSYIPQPVPSNLQYHGELLNWVQRQHCCMTTLPGGFSCGGPVSFRPKGKRNQPPKAKTSAQIPKLVLKSHECSGDTLDGPHTKTTTGDLTACQLPNPSSSLPQGDNPHSSLKPLEEALQKRELRLMKNREAARECRRKKKEYVKCLENRVAVLENQNKTLIEELRALKDIYRHKVE